jgi:hypothetical protein
MRFKFSTTLLLVTTGLCAALTSLADQKLVGHNMSGFDAVRKA